jgi:hypothetical protein
MQTVNIPREVLLNLAEAVHAQSSSEHEFISTLDNLRQLPENTIGCEVVRFIDCRLALAMPFSKVS